MALVRRKAFDRVGKFGADLPRELSLFQGNVARKMAEHDREPIAGFEITSVKVANYAARFGEMVMVNPIAGTLTIGLPRPDHPTADQIAIVNAGDSTTSVTLQPMDSDVTVGGAEELDLSGARFALLLHPDAARKNWIAFGGSEAAAAEDLQIYVLGSSGTYNDFTTTGWDTARYASFVLGGDTLITGFAVPTGAGAVFRKTLYVASRGYVLGIKGLAAASTATCRVVTPYPNDIYLQDQGWSADIYYDQVSQVWGVL